MPNRVFSLGTQMFVCLHIYFHRSAETAYQSHAERILDLGREGNRRVSSRNGRGHKVGCEALVRAAQEVDIWKLGAHRSGKRQGARIAAAEELQCGSRRSPVRGFGRPQTARTSISVRYHLVNICKHHRSVAPYVHVFVTIANLKRFIVGRGRQGGASMNRAL